ncbi:2-amino-4-hydroxy-6-hydroxymethyldihydropteridine diphosphokinase [Luteimonas sp. e5]
MRYLLLLGSNHRRAHALRLAARRLATTCHVIECAGPYPTRDARTAARYLNAGAIIESDAAPEALRQALRDIEREAGRDRSSACCVLDIDLVARLDARRVSEVFKPDDLEATYAAPLLAALGIRRD